MSSSELGHRLRMMVSADLAFAVGVAVIVHAALDRTVSLTLAKDLCSLSINVLAIVFAIYLAALGLIMSSGNDQFVKFLSKEGYFDRFIWTYKFTLGIVFSALFFSCSEYLYVDILAERKINFISRYHVILVVALFVYAISAATLSTMDAIRYSETRRKFIESGG